MNIKCEELYNRINVETFELTRKEGRWIISVSAEITDEKEFNCHWEYWLSQPHEDFQICIKKAKAKVHSKKIEDIKSVINEMDIESFIQEGIDTYQLYLETLEGNGLFAV